MALNDELRQRLVLVLQKQGTEAIDEVKARINDLKGEFERSGQALRDAFTAGTGDILEFNRQVKDLSAEYQELTRLIKEVEKSETQATQAVGDAQRLRIEAYAAAERALESQQKKTEALAEAERQRAQQDIQRINELYRRQELIDKQIIADRQQANAVNGVAREMQFYTDVLEEAYQIEMQEARATVVMTKSKEQLQQESDKLNRILKNTSFTTLAAAHAFQDWAQGGFGAVLNNIPLLSQNLSNLASDMLGFTESTRSKMALWGPGIAGVFSIVAVAAYELYTNWRTIDNMFNGGIPRPILDTTKELEEKLKKAKDTTEELGKLSTMTVDEIVRYKEATAQVKEFNDQLEREKELKKLLEGQSKEAKERSSGFKTAVNESGGSLALQELISAIGTQEDQKGMVWNPVKAKMSTARETAEDLFLAAGKEGDGQAIKAIQKFLQSAYGNRSDFGRKIADFSPEGQAMAKQGQKQAEMLADFNQKQADEDEKGRIKAEQDEERRLTVEARENEKAYDEKKKTIAAWAKEQQDEADRLNKSQQRQANNNAKDAKAFGKMEKSAEKQAQLNDLARRFEAEGFAPGAAMEGAKHAADRINKGQNENAAMAMVYRQMIKSAAQQEQVLGLLGQATQIMMQLEQQDRINQARLNQMQGKMNQTRSKRRSLQPTLPPN